MFKKILILLLTIISIVLISIGTKQYKENRIYERYIFQSISNNTEEMLQGIFQTKEIYKDILKEDKITKNQIKLLANYYSNILFAYQNNLNAAIQFNRLEEEKSKSVKRSLREISNYYRDILDDFNLENKTIEVTPTLRKKISKLQILNDLWVGKAKEIGGVKQEKGSVIFRSDQYREYYNNKTLNNDYWINLLVNMKFTYNNFLDKQNLIDINSLLQE